MDWLWFALIAASIYAAVNLMDKFVVDNEISDFWLSASLCGVAIFIFQAAVTFILGDISFNLQDTWSGFISGIIYTIGLLAYYYGIKEEDVSRFIPTTSLSTVFVAILSFAFLQESFNIFIYGGIASTVIGAFLISLEDPIHSLENFQSGHATLLALIAAFLFASRDVIFKFATSQLTEWSALFWMSIGGLTSSLLILARKRNQLKGKKQGITHLTAIGVLTATGYFFMAKAISLGPVSLVSATMKTQLIAVFIGSTVLSKINRGVSEDTDRFILIQKTVAIALILLGVITIQILL